MKLAIRITGTCAMALLLWSCGANSTAENRNSPGFNPTGVGPFDPQGNYMEDWADSPDKWRPKPSSRPRPNQQLAQNDAPPLIAASDQPPPNSVPIATSTPVRQVSNTPPPPRPAAQTATRTTTAAAAPKPKPKPVVVTPKKPAPTRYTVKKGDTLSAIASRNKSTVTAIQRANGIRGTIIRPGQVLVVPRY